MAGIAEDAPYGGCGFPVAGRAADMGQRNYFSHTILNCGGRQVFDVLAANNLSYSAAAENIGFESGVMDPAAAAQVLESQFMASPPHRANILNPNLTHVGVGSWRTASGQSWSGAGLAYPNVYVTAVIAHNSAGWSGPGYSGWATPGTPWAPPGVQVTVVGSGQATVSWGATNPGALAIDVVVALIYDDAGYTGRYVVACPICSS